MNSRVRLVSISIRSWLSYVTNNHQVRCVNMPRDANVEAVMPSVDTFGRDIIIWLSSPDFDEVPECGVIPPYQLLFEQLPLNEERTSQPPA